MGENGAPDNNGRTEQFQAHLKEILDGDYNVLPLPKILDMIRAEETIPPQTLAITFEGAYESAYQNAMQTLLRKNIPFTVFYASGDLDGQSDQHMTWSQLQSLAGYGNVTIGLLPAAYTHLVGKDEAEIRRQINNARQRHREKIGGPEPRLFSYPFGEYSLALRKIVKDSGFTAAFGTQSGVITPQSDPLSLPRFSMTERFGDLERFKLVTHALPLPVTDMEPADPLFDSDQPVIGFSVPAALAGEIETLSCFVSGQKPPTMQIIGTRVELRLADAPLESRLRINCTLRADRGPPAENTDDVEQWRWLSLMLTRKEPASIPRPAAPQ